MIGLQRLDGRLLVLLGELELAHAAVEALILQRCGISVLCGLGHLLDFDFDAVYRGGLPLWRGCHPFDYLLRAELDVFLVARRAVGRALATRVLCLAPLLGNMLGRGIPRILHRQIRCFNIPSWQIELKVFQLFKHLRFIMILVNISNTVARLIGPNRSCSLQDCYIAFQL